MFMDGIVTRLNKKASPSIHNITTKEEGERVLSAEPKVVLGFLNSLVLKKAKKVLEKKQQKGEKFSSPAKSAVSTPRNNSKSVTVKKKEAKKSLYEALSDKKKGNDLKPTTKKRKNSDNDNDVDSYDDFFG